MADRDDFTAATKRRIAERAGYICSHPTCGRMTVGPSEDRASGITMTGVAAHIVAAATKGPRSDATLSASQKSAASNGIWMCAIHGKWIDDNPSIATVEKLHEWKAAHEAEISAWVEYGHSGIFKSWDRLAALTRDQRDTIETSLPNGHAVIRDGKKLLAALEAAGSCVVSGDSGVGKSALVKTMLDTHFPDARQVWLGPEALQAALSEAERGRLELTAPLADLLKATTNSQNILVLDAVERADAITISRLSEMVLSLVDHRLNGDRSWWVIAIGQRAGFEVHLDPLVNALGGNAIVVSALEPEQVQEALQSIPALAQHAYDDALVAVLGNLRVLAWIIAAGSLFAGADAGRMAARSQIADRLWAHWTGGDPDLHSFMIAFALRDAEYERSFALSGLSAAERSAWKSGRQQMPLKLSDRNRLSFEHDLASDWARYQFLKEITDEVKRWAALANQPLWVAALQMFGQYLLREPDQANKGWDWAFAAAQSAKLTDAVDVLLDALCLDPFADNYLTARTSLLFANNGKLLDRLLARFMHIATVPEQSLVGSLDSDIGLYAEAEMRSPIWAFWSPLIRFLVKHRLEIAPFGSRIVSKICRFWLTKTPTRINDNLVLGRAGIVELAIETARVVQIENIVYSLHGGGSDKESELFTAALAGAEDNLEAVTAFALEMARRKPLGEEVQAKVDVLKAEEWKRREEAKKRASQPRSKATPFIPISSPRKLPPWPLGPEGRLNEAFRRAVLRDGALGPLMKVAPEIAAEVLLACIVEDIPVEEMRAMSLDFRLGLNWNHDDRPVLYWNSPFFPFLLQSAKPALVALLQLVQFCTEQCAKEEYNNRSAPIRLVLIDGTKREFVGGSQVLDWSHTRRATNSQLFSALDALERWLWIKINAGENVEDLCTFLLERSGSTAILGILADCAKLDPQLLRGPLAPLLTSPFLILNDEYRLNHRFGHDAFTWYRAGEKIREIGLEWEHAEHRVISLKQIIRDLRRRDPAFDNEAKKAFTAWPAAENEFDLRLRVLVAELDPVNWQEEPDAEGQMVWAFRYPEDMAAEIEALQPTQPDKPNLAMVLRSLEQMLGTMLSAEQSSELYGALDERDDLDHFDSVERSIIETAIAALLFARAGEWVTRDTAVAERLSLALERSMPPLEDIQEPLDDCHDYGPGLAWASVGAIYAKALGYGSPDRWDGILSYALATGEISIVRTITAAARGLRDELGLSYNAIIEVAVFAAVLNGLSPRYHDEPGSIEVILRWRRRLALRSLVASKCPATFDLVSLAQRIERLWKSRFRRSSGQQMNEDGHRNLHRRYSFGMGTQILAATFDWALQEEISPSTDEYAEHRRVIRMLWDFVEWRLRDDPYKPLDEYDGFDRVDDFGLAVIRTIAARIPMGNASESRILWEPVLALGPRGEFTLEHMIDCLFLRLYKNVDPANFIANWDAMLAFVFTPDWLKGGKWWQGRSILRHILGIDAAHQIASNSEVMAHVKALASYYEAFASSHIAHDDSALASFANFFASTAGSSLRIDAIRWIKKALDEDQSKLRGNAGSALAELAQALLAEHSVELIANRDSRQALNNIIGRMVRDQVPYALTLQDRARALR
ncbi:hypothetical protein SAMN02745824_1704 [Parasphingorhabdus marina DSM 22363]|uniref:Uncharacterized protein n=1 Tax=Parasphingorhabdus marina DSM 22363 TaxID=1123272 RepID=A0A1N6D8R6_9SPHN|nr:hypothetical protein [Parasphingorhabdus marina]SIN67211.1 hypothetical protein SAMN02745824_1704 [Parasphingorhabdus marina DSM 22363]